MMFIEKEKEEKMKGKKYFIAIGIMVLLFLLVGVGIVWSNHKNEEKAKQVLFEFVSKINEKKYEEMYQMVATMNRSQEDFVKRNQNIYEGIGSSNIKVEIQNIEKQGKDYQIQYHQKMFTKAGEVEFDNQVIVEKGNSLKWSSHFIFPQLEENQKVRISTIQAKRGDILDRNDEILATDGFILSAGIVPGKLGENKEQNISKIAELTEVSEEYIKKQLEASWVKEDTFVPIKKLSSKNVTLKEALLQIPGVLVNQEAGREYPLGKEAGHLIGYVQAINREELEEKEGKGYHTASLIGKAGIEKSQEDILRGIDGTEIYVTDENGNRMVQIVKQDKKDGQNVKLTIDSAMQTKLFEQLEKDKGFFVVMQPKTGELLALVSTPTFDSNDFSVGLSNKQWESLNQDANQPLYNRFLQRYCPGSTFKPVIGAIGLTMGKIQENEDFGYTGTSWQKDSLWGNYKITTLTGYHGAKNLRNAMIHSDNIYFAQLALKIGEKNLIQKFNQIGFNETFDFPLSLAKSQYAIGNGNQIEGETKLADTGYGQGDVLVNPIFMASVYSSFVNNGNMLKPYLMYEEKKQILKEDVFSEEATDIIRDSLIQVVENKEGTANDMKIQGVTIAGKTGTAELKSSSEDKQSGTLGWFNCFTVDRQNGNDLLIISMVENVQDNRDGGSHYLIQKIRKLF